MTRRSVAEFLERFVHPLVAGGTLEVGRPIAVAELDELERELAHASEAVVAVDDARAGVLVDLVVRPPALLLERDELELCAALHNVLFLAHPRADSWLATKGARKRVLETASLMAAQPLTTDRRRALARHGLLHNVFNVVRTDIKISWWTGSAQFYGQEPPTRLLRWRSVRRVREETSTASYDQLLTSDEAAPVMATLLRRSPITHLLAMHPQAPPLHWEDAVFVLRDPELARAIAYHATRPSAPFSLMTAPARYAAAFEQFLERSPPAADVRAVAAFLVYLNALLAMTEMRMREPGAKSPLITTVLAPDRAAQWPRGLTTFLALPNALARIEPVLAEPPGLGQEPRLYERWRVHREQVQAGVGEAVIDTLVNRLVKQLGLPPGLPSAPADAEPAGDSETAAAVEVNDG